MFIFVISENFIDRSEVNVAFLWLHCSVLQPIHVYKLSFLYEKGNQHRLIKYGKYFIINAYKGKSQVSLVSAHQAKKLINASKKYVLILLSQNQRDVNSMDEKHPWRDVQKNTSVTCKIFYRHIEKCSTIQMDSYLRGKWSTRYGY